jgi:hypothetical protein
MRMANAANDQRALSEFLRRKKGEASSDVDWDAKRDEWMASVKRLYQFLTDDLLKVSIDEKTIEVSKASKQITEEYIGTYTLPELKLKIGNAQVVFSPKGANVIGAAGRVDLRGDRDTVTLIREKASTASSDQWKLVLQRVPNVVTRPLDSDSLKWALEHVML